jgi:Na+/H+ antiporter NhaD/arsenite permease-like protein
MPGPELETWTVEAVAQVGIVGTDRHPVGIRARFIVVANLAARDGHPITFGQFLRYGSLVVAMSLTISTAYLWLRYLGRR